MKQLLIAALVITVCACKNTSSDNDERKDGFTPVLKTREDSLFHEVMQGHDIGMAKMSLLRKQSKRVQHDLDSIQKLPQKKIDVKYQTSLQDLRESLNYADQSMYKWMEEFEADSATTDKKKRIAYLESEKIKVVKVRDTILNSLQRADFLLKR